MTVNTSKFHDSLQALENIPKIKLPNVGGDLPSHWIFVGRALSHARASQARVALSWLNLAAQAMRNQLNVSSRTVIELTPAMTEHFAPKPVPAAVILNDDARPGEGPHQVSPQQERPSIPNQPADAPQTSGDLHIIFRSPIAKLPLDAPLTDRQLDYCRFVLRYGPTHPEFNDCSRRLDAETKTRATA
jgi:hypothetical protein